MHWLPITISGFTLHKFINIFLDTSEGQNRAQRVSSVSERRIHVLTFSQPRAAWISGFTSLLPPASVISSSATDSDPPVSHRDPCDHTGPPGQCRVISPPRPSFSHIGQVPLTMWGIHRFGESEHETTLDSNYLNLCEMSRQRKTHFLKFCLWYLLIYLILCISFNVSWFETSNSLPLGGAQLFS